MLLEYTVANFKSIGKPVVLSMLACKDDSLPDSLTTFGKVKVSDKSIVYGANGSGKSTLFQALALLQYFVSSSFSFPPETGLHIPYNKMLGPDVPFHIRLQFVKNGIRYAYDCSIRHDKVAEEYLYSFPKGRQTRIFDRTGQKIQFGTRFKPQLSRVTETMKPDQLFLSIAANILSVPEVQAAWQFITEDLVICDSRSLSDKWLAWSAHKMHLDPELKRKVTRLIQGLGIPITGFDTTFQKPRLSVREAALAFGNAPHIAPVQNEKPDFDIVVHYRDFSLHLLTEESAGLIQLFSFLCPFVDCLAKGKILLVDEVEAFLHESIVFSMIQSFSQSARPSQAQMICITHDTNLLDLSLFRRDQIWFTEKTQQNETDLYSLSAINHVRKDTIVAKNYLAGKYGAVPALDKPFHFNSDSEERLEADGSQ